jgi:hypothetical protein
MREIPLTQRKICNHCGEDKKTDEFCKCSQSLDGLQPRCRDCNRLYSKATKEQRKEYNRLYRLRHPEVGRKAQAKYRKAHREEVLKRNREYMRQIRKECPDKFHKRDRKFFLAKRGLTEDEYNRLFEQQGGVCAICGHTGTGKHGYLCVDHDHKTGKVRGLLCNSCNMGLGHFGDNASILKKMIDYLAFAEAVAARDEAAKKYHGEFANLK